jgi:thiol-disulfide isomerase/thioredoxin
MKNLTKLLLVLTTFGFASCEESKGFKEGNITVTVKLDEISSGTAVLEVLPSGPKRLQLDTVQIGENGVVSFAHLAAKTAFYSVYVPGYEGEIQFMANPGDSIEISGNVNALYATCKIGGTAENERLDSLVTFLKAAKYYTDSLQRVFKAAEAKQLHHALMNEFQQLYGNLKRKEETFVKGYITRNLGQYSNLIAVNSLNKDRHKTTYLLVDSALLKNHPNNEDVLKYHEIIAQVFASSVGGIAPDFSLLNLENKQVNLSDFKGKYVLLDFWATWCNPCIKEIPNLVNIKEEFKDKPFEIISICIDKNSKSSVKSWQRIIEKFNGDSWVQLYDTEGKETRRKYNIQHFPTLLLIDPSGEIVEAGNHLRGENISRVIKGYLGNE